MFLSVGGSDALHEALDGIGLGNAIEESGSIHERPRVHVDLDKSVANIYRAVMAYAPFGFFVDGGRAMVEGRGEFESPEILVGDDAMELDRFVIEQFGLESPGYVSRLEKIEEVDSDG
ncbi:MAG: hypothetical protein JXA14_07580 [Anaerolineae bacterium]|nr:hypothetical protein [Anaerolineae bacterium]